MAVVCCVADEKIVDGKRAVTATCGQVELAFREIIENVFLIEKAVLQTGKKFFPDEPKANYLISKIACGKVILWPRGLDFLDRRNFFVGTRLPPETERALAEKAGIDPDGYFWSKVSETNAEEIYRIFCL